ncbi:hypothetical protein [Acetobacterium wieringae]|uniref:hypothetical protein n=1 Tax=Acetobacterium wieringae TaxID=52694 RepID=UPI002B1FAC72|nr:hypothetical protein [Acetobacterium wieringae]MEA4804383.1 hypothetical protein [Acetobacterium wieringae]
MIILIEEEQLKVDNDPQKIQYYFDQIEIILRKNSWQLSHLVVDDQPVYDNYYQYFLQHIETIRLVKVIIQNIKNLVNETLFSTYDYLNNGIPIIKKLSDEFYQQPVKKTWENLNNLFEGIQWIIITIDRIDVVNNLDQMINHYETWNEYVQIVSDLNDIVPQLEEAMVNQDRILIADLLLYEMVPVFEKMAEKVMFLLPGEVKNFVS